MRVTGGARKGRRLAAFGHSRIRPTTDKVREAVFNVLGQSLEGKRVLDLFAGTGAMAIEALSRGATQAVLVDRSQKAASLIKENLKICGYSGVARVIKKDAVAALKELEKEGQTFHIIFMDAPYGEPETTLKTLRAIAQGSVLEAGCIVVCESSKHHRIEPPEGLELLKHKRYGDTEVYFMEKK